jgi:hypothetical protein
MHRPSLEMATAVRVGWSNPEGGRTSTPASQRPESNLIVERTTGCDIGETPGLMYFITAKPIKTPMTSVVTPVAISHPSDHRGAKGTTVDGTATSSRISTRAFGDVAETVVRIFLKALPQHCTNGCRSFCGQKRPVRLALQNRGNGFR